VDMSAGSEQGLVQKRQRDCFKMQLNKYMPGALSSYCSIFALLCLVVLSPTTIGVHLRTMRTMPGTRTLTMAIRTTTIRTTTNGLGL